MKKSILMEMISRSIIRNLNEAKDEMNPKNITGEGAEELIGAINRDNEWNQSTNEFEEDDVDAGLTGKQAENAVKKKVQADDVKPDFEEPDWKDEAGQFDKFVQDYDRKGIEHLRSYGTDLESGDEFDEPIIDELVDMLGEDGVSEDEDGSIYLSVDETQIPDLLSYLDSKKVNYYEDN